MSFAFSGVLQCTHVWFRVLPSFSILVQCKFHMLSIYMIYDGNTTLRCHNLFNFCRRIVSWASLRWSSGVDFRIPSPGTAEGTGRSRKPLFLAQALPKAVWQSRNCCIALWCWQVILQSRLRRCIVFAMNELRNQSLDHALPDPATDDLSVKLIWTLTLDNSTQKICRTSPTQLSSDL